MVFLKSIQLNSLISQQQGIAQGVQFEPDIIYNLLCNSFNQVRKLEIDSFSTRIKWAEMELDKPDSNVTKKVLSKIIHDCEGNLPAVSFILYEDQLEVCQGDIFKYGIRFFAVEGVNGGQIPPRILERLRDFLSMFSLNYSES